MTPEGILQYCLEEVAAGRLTIAECVERFPQVDDLAEHLLIAQSLAAMPKHEVHLRPSAAWGVQIQQQMRRQAAEARSRAQRLFAFGWLVRWAVAVAICLLPAWAGVGVVSAAANSLPGDALYGVKRAAEGAWLALTPGGQQAGLHLALAETRAGELSQVAGRATTPLDVIETLTSEMLHETDSALAEIESATHGQQSILLAQTLVTIEMQRATLEKVKVLVPSAGHANIDECLEVTRAQLAYTEQVQLQTVAALAGVTATAAVLATSGPPPHSATAIVVAGAASATPSPTPLLTLTVAGATVTPRTATATASASPTASPTPSLTPSPTATLTATPTETLTPTETVTPTATVTETSPPPTGTPSATDTPTVTATATASATSTPMDTETPTPTDLPADTPTPTLAPSATPLPTDTASPTASPTVEVTATETPTFGGPEGN